MIDIDATVLIAFVAPTVALFGASFFTTGIIGTGQQLRAFHLLVHMTATAFDTGLFITRWTRTCVTLGQAHMRTTWLTARQLFLAYTAAQWNGIHARFSLLFADGCFATWTRGHFIWHQFAANTRTRMAFFQTFMILTVERFIAHLLTREMNHSIVFISARHLTNITATITCVLYFFVAFGARPTMTFDRTSMHLTIQLFVTVFIAFQIIFLTALHGFRTATTATGARNCCMTRRTWT